MPLSGSDVQRFSGSGTETRSAIRHPLGGDEVSLFYAPYVATHTDRRLFIADPGNSRVLSVRLNYHTTDRVDLKDIKEAAK